ncbi:Heterogeneous nuclear ribonucleoprotein A3 [Apostichopus japonicus]|uniref:Heterogeneous nuclear ribonucleoprotein A3 n=1 Tax=Stichopus japonicus TaxID=307972 RepID=A0A2G8JLQ9_STIJA|nr:Heterogeneous nuclear ribonucleoprotein A3 [Apostichopus japonicus]
MRKLFLGGLSFSTTEDDIKEAFQHYGKIVDCVVIRDPTRRDDPTPSRSRGFGFVTFQTAQETQAVLDARKREKIKMNGREIDIKRAMAREDSEKDPTVNEETMKIYIYGIGSLREEDLKEYFSQHGEVKNVIIPKQSADRNKIRGFAFVEFTDYDIVDTLVAMKTHTIGGVSLEVKKATPQTKGGRDRGGGMGDRMRGGFDGGFGGPTGFVPRGYGGGGGFGGAGAFGGGGLPYGGGGNRGFAEDRYGGGGRNQRDNFGGGGGYNDGFGRQGGYDDSYNGGQAGYNRGFSSNSGAGGGGYRGDGFGGGYAASGGYNDGYASQRSSFGPVRGGKRSSGVGGGGPYGGKML